MNILIVDTSCDSLTIGIKKGEETFGYKSTEARKGHSTMLLPALNELLNKAVLKLSEVDYFGAVTGPGSFTGVRIGVATVNAFGYAGNKKVVPVTAFEPFTYNKCDDVCFVIDAKHAFYTATKRDTILTYETIENSILPNGSILLDVDSVTPEMLIGAMEEKIKKGEYSASIKPFYMRASEAERNLKK